MSYSWLYKLGVNASTLYGFNHVLKNVDGAMHFIYSHKYNTNSAEDLSDMNGILFIRA